MQPPELKLSQDSKPVKLSPYHTDSSLPFYSNKAENSLEPELSESYNAWKLNQDNKSRAAMLKHLQPTIEAASRTYNITSPSVKSQAKLLALSALNTYDPAKGKLRSHVLTQLQGLQRHQARSEQIIRLPERFAIAHKQLHDDEGTLTDDLGRLPTDEELADHTGLSMARIAKIRNYSKATNTGQYMDEDGGTYSVASKLPGDTSHTDMWESLVYDDLSTTDKTIMEHTLGMRGRPVLENRQLAAKLGLSPGAISQRKAKIQAMLDEQFFTSSAR